MFSAKRNSKCIFEIENSFSKDTGFLTQPLSENGRQRDSKRFKAGFSPFDPSFPWQGTTIQSERKLNEYTFEKIWPISVSELTEEQVLGLSKSGFAKLSTALRERAEQLGHTRRSAIENVRKLKKLRSKKLRHQALLHEQEMLDFEFTESPLLDCFQPNRERSWIKPAKRKLVASISAENFSIVDDPVGTLKTLSELVRFEGLAKSAKLNFLDSRVLDVSPFLLFGMLSQRMAPYVIGGKISPGAQKVLEAVEMRDFLGIQPFRKLPNKVDVWPFPLQRRHTPSETSPDAGDSITFQKLSDKLVDTVNNWLAALPEPRTLSGEAMGQISNIAVETLNNAERHSRPEGNGDWVMAGFMARREIDGDDTTPSKYNLDHWYDCHLAFVNRGRPISEALSTSPSEEVINFIKTYQKKHRSRLGNSGCSLETLATVCSLQDDISSKPQNAGGKGMMTIVEVTNALSLTHIPTKAPRITIVSGKSCVMFSGEFCGFDRSGKERTGRTQFFNSEQSIEHPPSNEHVFDLDVEFPGTVIAVRFTLDPNTMEALDDDS